MSQSSKSYNGVQDDPRVYDYASWRSLIGHFVAIHIPDWMVANGGVPLEVHEVLEAVVGREHVWLKMKMWPGDTETWVGGHRFEMYSICRRPEGGFQVAGNKFNLIGSREDQVHVDEVIDVLASGYDPKALAELREQLSSARPDVLYGLYG